jgi:hypothetical protein
MKCSCYEITWILSVLKGVIGGGGGQIGAAESKGRQTVYFKLQQLAFCTQKFKFLSQIDGIPLNNCNFGKFVIFVRVGHCVYWPRALTC